MCRQWRHTADSRLHRYRAGIIRLPSSANSSRYATATATADALLPVSATGCSDAVDGTAVENKSSSGTTECSATRARDYVDDGVQYDFDQTSTSVCTGKYTTNTDICCSLQGAECKTYSTVCSQDSISTPVRVENASDITGNDTSCVEQCIDLRKLPYIRLWCRVVDWPRHTGEYRQPPSSCETARQDSSSVHYSPSVIGNEPTAPLTNHRECTGDACTSDDSDLSVRQQRGCLSSDGEQQQRLQCVVHDSEQQQRLVVHDDDCGSACAAGCTSTNAESLFRSTTSALLGNYDDVPTASTTGVQGEEQQRAQQSSSTEGVANEECTVSCFVSEYHTPSAVGTAALPTTAGRASSTYTPHCTMGSTANPCRWDAGCSVQHQYVYFRFPILGRVSSFLSNVEE
eukprot:Lankesteria_metandrocarpae@DN4019_c0_g1_i1.p1